MPLLSEIPKLLQAFLGLITRPFRQSLEDSVRGAGTAITLAATFTAIGDATLRDAAAPSLTLVLVWMAVTAVVAKADDRNLKIARNLGVISFWIATTSAFIMAAGQIYDSYDRAPRFYFVAAWLTVLVPIHMFRNLQFWKALIMTVALWISTGLLARIIVY